jgi:hypothetical protein
VADGIATVIYRGMSTGSTPAPALQSQGELPALVQRLEKTAATLEELLEPVRKLRV